MSRVMSVAMVSDFVLFLGYVVAALAGFLRWRERMREAQGSAPMDIGSLPVNGSTPANDGVRLEGAPL